MLKCDQKKKKESLKTFSREFEKNERIAVLRLNLAKT